MEMTKKRVIIAEDKNDTILFQNLDEFLGYNPQDRHPFTGKRMTRLTNSGQISSVCVLANGTLLEMRLPRRRIFRSYRQWMDFVAPFFR
jgi:hypothetical protein